MPQYWYIKHRKITAFNRYLVITLLKFFSRSWKLRYVANDEYVCFDCPTLQNRLSTTPCHRRRHRADQSAPVTIKCQGIGPFGNQFVVTNAEAFELICFSHRTDPLKLLPNNNNDKKNSRTNETWGDCDVFALRSRNGNLVTLTDIDKKNSNNRHPDYSQTFMRLDLSSNFDRQQ